MLTYLRIPEDSRQRPEINPPPSIFLIREPPQVLNDSVVNILRIALEVSKPLELCGGLCEERLYRPVAVALGV